MKRLYNLDYFRGILAFLIMIYHYFYWAEYDLDGSTFLGKVGLYGVTGFYVLSGLTLYYVYNTKLGNGWKDIKRFFIKRVLRIFPLLIIVTILTIVFRGKVPPTLDLILNLTGTFGFFKWDTYFAVGAWSIGNELVFYAFFPFIMLLLRRSLFCFILFYLATIVFAYYFSKRIVSDAELDLSWWRSYVNPLNQIVYFTSGIFLGVISKRIKINTTVGVITLLLLITSFVLFPTSNEKYLLVTGLPRILLSFLVIIMVLVLYKTEIRMPKYLNSILVFYGDISYSLYLYHPVVFSVSTTALLKLNIEIPTLSKIFLCIVISTILSYTSYEYFEKRFTQRA